MDWGGIKVKLEQSHSSGSKEKWLYFHQMTKKMGRKLALKRRRQGAFDTMPDGKGSTLYKLAVFQSSNMTKWGPWLGSEREGE